MKAELWSEILDRLEDQYGKVNVEHHNETRVDDTGQKLVSEIDKVEFETAQGRMKVELVTAPMILDKKTHFNHTAGASANVEYVLSDTEKTQRIRAYRYDDDTDDWIEINTSSGFLG